MEGNAKQNVVIAGEHKNMNHFTWLVQTWCWERTPNTKRCNLQVTLASFSPKQYIGKRWHEQPTFITTGE